MDPDYCRRCRQSDEPCAQGLPGAGGKLCPQVEHAPRTVEGHALWRLVARPGVWTGGGLSAPRLDRAEIRARMDQRVEPWVLDDLLDAVEPALVAGLMRRDPKPGVDRRDAKEDD